MKKIFPYIYGIFILSQFMMGQIYLPGLPLNLLQITTLLLLPLCLMIERKLPYDKYILMYFVFLLFYLISATFTGYTDTLFGSVLPQLLISFTAFWSTKILVQKYDSLLPLVIPLILAGLVDSIVTILQATGNPIVSPALLILMQDPEALDMVADGMLGQSISGLFLNPVFNGHALLFCFVCSLFIFQGRYKLLGVVFSTIIFAGLFFCQQRSAFYLSLLVLIYIGWKLMQNNLKSKIFVLLSLGVFVIFLLPLIESYAIESGSRITDTSMTGREEIWMNAANFLMQHLLFGGFDLFVKQTGQFPHNLFFSAFLAGGLIGGCVLMIMIFKLIFGSLKSMRYYNKHNMSILVSGCLIIVLIGDSLIHNTGLVEADFATFLSMSLCIYYNEKNPRKVFRVL